MLPSEDDGHHDQRHLHQEEAEAPHAAFEFGYRRAQHQPRGDLAELGPGAGADDQGPGAAADHVGPHKQGIDPLVEGGVRRQHGYRLFGGIGLAGQGRFIHEELVRGQDEAIARDHIPGGQDDDIPGNDLLHRDFRLLSVAPHRGLDLHHRQELRQGIGRAPLLPKPQQAADHHNKADDDGIGPVGQKIGKDGRAQQNNDDGALELGQEQGEGIGLAFRFEEIGAVEGQALPGLIRGQPRRSGL